jgi:hypothetical protein
MSINPSRIELIDDLTARVLSGMSVSEKLEMANRMVIEAREMVTHIVRQHHPGWSEQEILTEVRRRVARGAA